MKIKKTLSLFLIAIFMAQTISAATIRLENKTNKTLDWWY